MSKAYQERTKVVVRNLPPTLAAEAFQFTIDKLAEGTYNWLAYYPGKVSLKRTVFSRAFINFNASDAVIGFKNKFDGHVFVSTRGTQYRCSVEYAMFQRVPAANPKKLAMEGTIERDVDYQAFLKTLEEGPRAVPTAQAQLEAQEAARSGEESGPIVTALMAFLQKKYESTPFTGRRGVRAARKREGVKLASLLEEEPDLGKAAKARSKSSRSSRVTAEGEAATTAAPIAAATAATAGAATHAVKGGKQKRSRHGRKQQDDCTAAEPAVKDKKPGKSGSVAAGLSTDDKPSKRKQHLSRPAATAAETVNEADIALAAARGDGEDARQAAAAALVAASAANAAAAARKSRVKAGHQVYTPGARAGGRLFAAALPKGAAGGTSSAGMDDGGKGTASQMALAVVDAGSSRASNRPAANKGTSQATLAAEGSSGHRAGPTGKKGAGAGAAAKVAVGDGGAVGTTSAGAASAGSSKAAAGATADTVGGGRGGRGRSRGGSTGRQQHQQPQQQQWLPKAGGAG